MKLLGLFGLAFGMSAICTFILTTSAVKERLKIQPPPLATAFSLQNAPTESLQGEIVSFSGDVAWQSRIATQPAQLKTARKVLQGENVVTKNTGKVTMTFLNTTTLIMLPNTEVDIIQTLPTNMVFVQQSGTTTYTVFGKVPVSARAQDLLVQQKQGTMNIIVDKDAATVMVKVTDGNATTAYTDSDNTSVVTPITSGQSFVFDETSLTGVIQ
jgi:hypothetical protein